MTKLDKLKLPVPNLYGNMVRIDKVNMLIERAYRAGQEENMTIKLRLEDVISDIVRAMHKDKLFTDTEYDKAMEDKKLRRIILEQLQKNLKDLQEEI